MSYGTIQQTVQFDLCCGCGVCKGICPKSCITWHQKGGLYIPNIDESQCVNCGLCASVCPGLKHQYSPGISAKETITGSALSCYTAWTKDAQIRHSSASGGVVSTVIHQLLSSGIYDGAFCLDSYDYRTQLKTWLYTSEEINTCRNNSNIPKSRYLPVSHENAVTYIQQNRAAKLIFVGTSCAIRGLQNVIEKLNLPRDQYLFIGLFCDMVFNYNVLTYWQNQHCGNSTLAALHFKNKESGGWPGDMKFYPENEEPFYVPSTERAKAKTYFMPQRCLYCVDKLNACADISLGDNYTGKDDSSLGSNSVIIRTQTGEKAWLNAMGMLEIRLAELTDIQTAQYLDGRLNNLYFGDIKSSQIIQPVDLNPGVPREQAYQDFIPAWKHHMQQIHSGASYLDHPQNLEKQLKKDAQKPNPLIRFLKRCYHFIKRKMK